MSSTVSPATDGLPLERLQAWLAPHVPALGRIHAADKFAGGQSNPTYRLRTDGGDLVLRRKPPGVLLPSAHAVDREYRVMHALHDTPVPVPRMRALCSDDSVIGSMFYVMDFVGGRIFWNAALPEQQPAERAALFEAMVQTLAALHQVQPDAVGLADYGKAGNYFARQIARWSEQYRASATEANPAMDALIAWLPAHLPADDGRVSLIHGDYRIDNLVFHATEPRILAVLDWELSTLGHPWADLAYQCAQLRLPPDAAILGLGGLDRAALGIPSEAEYVARYCALMGIDGIAHWDFYIVFSLFKLSAILQGVKKRALEGNASSQKARDYGALARPLSEMAAAMLRG